MVAQAAAQDRPPAGGPAASRVPAPSEAARDAAKSAFERLSPAERSALQDALVWTGDHNAAVTGEFGPRTFEAITGWQRRTGRAPTGALDPGDLQAILASGARARAAAGFALVLDPVTGIRIGVPERLLPKRSRVPAGSVPAGGTSPGGTRFQSADGRITLDTRAQDGGDDLRALYERTLAANVPGRTVTYRVLRPDFFVVSGTTETGKFFTRFAQVPEGSAPGPGGSEAGRASRLRGFSVGYDKALAGEFDRVVIAVANSFEPFPAAGGVAAAPAVATAPAEPAGVARGPDGTPAAPPRRPPQAGPSGTGQAAALFTGLAVSPRRILTSGAVASCRAPSVDGAPARLLRGEAGRGLALIEPATPHRTAPLLFPAGPPPGAEETVAVLFLAPGEGGHAVLTPAGIVAAGRLVAPLQAGASGGLVLGRGGAVLGLVGSLAGAPRAVAGLVPPASYPFASAANALAFLGPDAPPAPAAQLAPEGRAPASLGALSAALAPALAAVSCTDAAP